MVNPRDIAGECRIITTIIIIISVFLECFSMSNMLKCA